MPHVDIQLIPRPDRRKVMDRRTQWRGGRRTSDDELSVVRLACRVISAYAEQPGLKLTVEQTARLVAADVTTCSDALLLLAREGVLKRTARGQFVMF